MYQWKIENRKWKIVKIVKIYQWKKEGSGGNKNVVSKHFTEIISISRNCIGWGNNKLIHLGLKVHAYIVRQSTASIYRNAFSLLVSVYKKIIIEVAMKKLVHWILPPCLNFLCLQIKRRNSHFNHLNLNWYKNIGLKWQILFVFWIKKTFD